MKKLHVILFECTKMIKSYALVLEKKMMLKTAFIYDLIFLQQVKKNIYCNLIHVECDQGTFGTNCSSVCGHCHQRQSCDMETGACPKGCDSGYQGIYCNKSKIFVGFNSTFVPYRLK